MGLAASRRYWKWHNWWGRSAKTATTALRMESCPSEIIPLTATSAGSISLASLSKTARSSCDELKRARATRISPEITSRMTQSTRARRHLVAGHPAPGSPGLASQRSLASDLCDANAPSPTLHSDASDAQQSVRTPALLAPSTAGGFRSHFCALDSATVLPMRSHPIHILHAAVPIGLLLLDGRAVDTVSNPDCGIDAPQWSSNIIPPGSSRFDGYDRQPISVAHKRRNSFFGVLICAVAWLRDVVHFGTFLLLLPSTAFCPQHTPPVKVSLRSGCALFFCRNCLRF